MSSRIASFSTGKSALVLDNRLELAALLEITAAPDSGLKRTERARSTLLPRCRQIQPTAGGAGQTRELFGPRPFLVGTKKQYPCDSR